MKIINGVRRLIFFTVWPMLFPQMALEGMVVGEGSATVIYATIQVKVGRVGVYAPDVM